MPLTASEGLADFLLILGAGCGLAEAAQGTSSRNLPHRRKATPDSIHNGVDPHAITGSQHL
jgi:hypothetical protein